MGRSATSLLRVTKQWNSMAWSVLYDLDSSLPRSGPVVEWLIAPHAWFSSRTMSCGSSSISTPSAACTAVAEIGINAGPVIGGLVGGATYYTTWWVTR